MILTKVISQKSQLSVQSEIFNQKSNNDSGNCIQEGQVIELSDLNLNLNLNLSTDEGNKLGLSWAKLSTAGAGAELG